MKTLLLSLLMFLAADTLSAQEKTTSEMLQGKVWVRQFSHKVEFSSEIMFTGNEYTTNFSFKGEKQEAKNPYYLSDEISWTFDEQKVGQTENGKYIIINYTKKSPETGPYKQVWVYEISKLTKKELHLKNPKNNTILIYKSKETNG